jgi:hypothetical protein
MYFLDWNSEFQPLSIHVTALHLAKSADITDALPTLMRVDVAQSLGPPLQGTLFGGFGNLSAGSGTLPTHSLTCCVMISPPGLPNWYCFSLTWQAHWPTFLIGRN